MSPASLLRKDASISACTVLSRTSSTNLAKRKRAFCSLTAVRIRATLSSDALTMSNTRSATLSPSSSKKNCTRMLLMLSPP